MLWGGSEGCLAFLKRRTLFSCSSPLSPLPLSTKKIGFAQTSPLSPTSDHTRICIDVRIIQLFHSATRAHASTAAIEITEKERGRRERRGELRQEFALSLSLDSATSRARGVRVTHTTS